MELVISCHLFDRCTGAVVLEHGEVADQLLEPAKFAHTRKHHLQLGQVRVGQCLPGDRPSVLEPFPPSCEYADARLNSVRNHQDCVHGE